MTQRTHHYAIDLRWTGNRGTGTSAYRAYDRSHEIRADGKPPLHGSADSAFLGDPQCWNPEQLLLASLSACHQLWYLHLCADAGIIVLGYEDHATGTMIQEADGGGQFTEVVLSPVVTVAGDSDSALARHLHSHAAAKCFIARSMGFPVRHEPTIRTAD